MSAATLTVEPLLAEAGEAVSIRIASGCECRFCVQCSSTFSGQYECFCGGESIPEVECYGCVEDACEYVGVIAAQWFAANPTTSHGWTVMGTDLILHEGAPVARKVQGQGAQQWYIEPWAGGRMEVALLRDGLPLGPAMSVAP